MPPTEAPEAEATTTTPTPDQVRSTYPMHHEAWAPGYVSRRLPDGIVEAYEGRFGTGWVIRTPSWKHTSRHRVAYHIAP